MKEIKFGIIGTGAIFTLSHANAINKIPNAKITNIFDINHERAQKCANDWNIENISKSVDELL